MSKKVTEQVGLIDKLIGKLERTQAANMKAFADAAIDLSRVREKPRAIGDDPKQDVESQLWNIADALQVIGYAVEASLRMKSKAEAEFTAISSARDDKAFFMHVNFLNEDIALGMGQASKWLTDLNTRVGSVSPKIKSATADVSGATLNEVVKKVAVAFKNLADLNIGAQAKQVLGSDAAKAAAEAKDEGWTMALSHYTEFAGSLSNINEAIEYLSSLPGKLDDVQMLVKQKEKATEIQSVDMFESVRKFVRATLILERSDKNGSR